MIKKYGRKRYGLTDYMDNYKIPVYNDPPPKFSSEKIYQYEARPHVYKNIHPQVTACAENNGRFQIRPQRENRGDCDKRVNIQPVG
ncbi:MAG: hypothetical protein LBT12_08155 [Oscillospiraceae bacterium]|nr:hypothetical protein [Oscillospiraceae bacterium]